MTSAAAGQSHHRYPLDCLATGQTPEARGHVPRAFSLAVRFRRTFCLTGNPCPKLGGNTFHRLNAEGASWDASQAGHFGVRHRWDKHLRHPGSQGFRDAFSAYESIANWLERAGSGPVFSRAAARARAEPAILAARGDEHGHVGRGQYWLDVLPEL